MRNRHAVNHAILRSTRRRRMTHPLPLEPNRTRIALVWPLTFEPCAPLPICESFLRLQYPLSTILHRKLLDLRLPYPPHYLPTAHKMPSAATITITHAQDALRFAGLNLICYVLCRHLPFLRPFKPSWIAGPAFFVPLSVQDILVCYVTLLPTLEKLRFSASSMFLKEKQESEGCSRRTL